jgi:hypothetical protein
LWQERFFYFRWNWESSTYYGDVPLNLDANASVTPECPAYVLVSANVPFDSVIRDVVERWPIDLLEEKWKNCQGKKSETEERKIDSKKH